MSSRLDTLMAATLALATVLVVSTTLAAVAQEPAPQALEISCLD